MLEESENYFLIQIHGDSLSLPRNKEGVPFYLTYPELIRSSIEEIKKGKKIYLYNFSRGSITINQVYQELLEKIGYFSRTGNILVIQIGVCDCAPRPIPYWLRNIIGTLPEKARTYAIKQIHTNRPLIQRAGIKWQMVPPRTFLEYYAKLLSVATKAFDRIYLINIAPTNPETEMQSPGFSFQIEKYNSLIKEVVENMNNEKLRLLDVHSKIKNKTGELSLYINKDGVHITVLAHRMYADMILKDYRI